MLAKGHKPSEAELAELRTKFEDVFEVDASGFFFYVKRPLPAPVHAALGLDGVNRVKAIESLARSCVVWPSPEEYGAITLKYPALPIAVGGFLFRLAEADEDAEAKKV